MPTDQQTDWQAAERAETRRVILRIASRIASTPEIINTVSPEDALSHAQPLMDWVEQASDDQDARSRLAAVKQAADNRGINWRGTAAELLTDAHALYAFLAKG